MKKLNAAPWSRLAVPQTTVASLAANAKCFLFTDIAPPAEWLWKKAPISQAAVCSPVFHQGIVTLATPSQSCWLKPWTCFCRVPQVSILRPGMRLPWRVDADEQHVVALDLDGLLVGEGDRLTGPEVFAGLRAVQPELDQVEVEGVGGVAAVADSDDGYGDGSALELAGPDLDFAGGVGADALPAQWVLVDGDDVAVHEDGLDLRLHAGQVVACQQGRGNDLT